jgi:peptide/nickel transport system permease protein
MTGRRLLLSIPLLFLVSAISFVLLALTPGNVAREILGVKATRQQIAALERSLGVDRPLYDQYWHWLTHALRGDLGHSIISGQSVSSLITSRISCTASLIVGTFLVFLVVGVMLGVFSAVRGGTGDRVADAFSLVGYALPPVWVGAILIELFAVTIRAFPAVGYSSPSQGVGAWLRSLTLPVIALSIGFIAAVAKQTREAMLDVLASEHIRMARASGVPSRSIIWRYAMKNVAIRVVTVTGLLTIGLLGADVIVENVFALPGLGQSLVNATLAHDVPIVQGITVIFTIVIVLITLLTDVAYRLLDPRVRAV